MTVGFGGGMQSDEGVLVTHCRSIAKNVGSFQWNLFVCLWVCGRVCLWVCLSTR